MTSTGVEILLMYDQELPCRCDAGFIHSSQIHNLVCELTDTLGRLLSWVCKNA